MNQRLNPFRQTDALDEVLLDVAALIELSPRDRRVADNRYHLLKEHLERKGSPLAPYLVGGVSLIYAQGSIAASTTIVSGTEDDRFDVDAIVEMDVPAHWDNDRALDLLEESLQGFPGVVKIVRCTRCVQLQFAFMHMDVTIMDRSARLAVERAGEIFHSPDKGESSRVPSNPWGFTSWFRRTVGIGQDAFKEILRRHRGAAGRDRLPLLNEHERLVVAKADQIDLPPMIPSAIDAQEAVALKLLKRFLNLRYEGLPMKRPPSIYLTKRAGDVGCIPQGLTAQLFALADSTAKIMRGHVAAGTRPRELNPSYHPDRINDRWPADGAAGVKDMKMFAEHLEYLCARLEQMAIAPLDDMAKTIDELFGERVGKAQREAMAGLGKSAGEIAAFYYDDGRHIFPPLPRRKLGRWWKLWCALHGPKLNHEELERALKRRFGDHVLGESSCRLVIPAFMMPKTEIAVFKTDHHEDFRNDHKTPMWKVSSSAGANRSSTHSIP